MIFTEVIVTLNYKVVNKEAIFNKLGNPVHNVSNDADDGTIYIAQKEDALCIVDRKDANKMLVLDDNRDKSSSSLYLYSINEHQYKELTEGHAPLVTPKVGDRLSVRLASSFVGNMSKLIALFLTAALMPVFYLVAIPFTFALSYFVIHAIRYRTVFKRWPNKREFEHMLGQALVTGMEMIVAMGLFMLLSGVTAFAPITAHVFAILGVTVAGPVLTFIVVPIVMATILATGVTLFNLGLVIFQHFFDSRFYFSRRFPFFFEIGIRKNRDSLGELGNKLMLTCVKEFTSGLISSLAAIYLSFIPASLLANYLSGTASTALFLTVQFTATILNSLVIALALDKLFEYKINPKLTQFWNTNITPNAESPNVDKSPDPSEELTTSPKYPMSSAFSKLESSDPLEPTNGQAKTTPEKNQKKYESLTSPFFPRGEKLSEGDREKDEEPEPTQKSKNS